MCTWPRRCYRCLIRDTLEWHPPPHVGTRAGSPSLPTPALTAASADTSPVSLRAVSNSGETRHRGLRPDAPVPSRTLTPGPPGPPPHLAQLTAVWHTLSAATQAELGHVSSDQVAEGLELARFRDLALADEAHRRALDPLLQRARLVSDQKRAVDDEIAALHRAHAERVATITGDVHEPLSPVYVSVQQQYNSTNILYLNILCIVVSVGKFMDDTVDIGSNPVSKHQIQPECGE